MSEPIPSLFEWAGGAPAIDCLMDGFYAKVRQDPMLAPVFQQTCGEHPLDVEQRGTPHLD